LRLEPGRHAAEANGPGLPEVQTRVGGLKLTTMKFAGLKLLAVLVLAAAATSLHAVSVTLEAESGTLGTNFVTGNSSGTIYISNTNNNPGNNPGLPGRVATFSVTFSNAGTYQLYARVRVGTNTFNDDSMFYGNGFGTKTPTVNSDWVLVNGLGSVGYTTATDLVAGGGNAGSSVWKWINLSLFAPGPTFTVSAGGLTQTFQIGSREDGLDVDKLLFGTSTNTFTVAELDAGGPGTPPSPPTNPPPFLEPRDLVAGNLIQFNDNGAWCWYQDERAVVEQMGGKLIVGSDASAAGVGGSPRNGAVDAAVFDLQTGSVQRTELLPTGTLGCDDHNAPAFMARPDGKCLAQYAGHNANFLTYFRIYDGSAWLPQTTFDWTSAGAVSGEQTSYSNPHYLAVENRAYTFVRCIENRSPHFLVSTNLGDTWRYGGQLVEPDGVVGYNSGYFRYSDNGRDRIDFICTEAHPRDIQTSIYHGYISNGMSFKSDGTAVDTNIFDTLCPVSRNFTLVFSNGTVMPPGMTNYRCWNSDVQRYADGTVQCIIHARINQVASGGYPDTVDPNHAFFFCRYNGTNWTTTYLCQAGYKMYSDEADYVGLGCLSPNDPNTIFISTKYDPRAVQPGVFDTNQPYSNAREIWKGVTTNHGAGFTWTKITRDSVRDNFRPLIPAWDANHTALFWFRGSYYTAQSFDASIVGIVERRSEISSWKTFVDATTNNTTLATGAALVAGPGANEWHERSGSFNGGAVLASADATAENAPLLKTTIAAPQSGTYDVWINFWGNPAADWRIKAGLATNGMKILRQLAGQQVGPGQHTSALVLTNSATNFLYQAYAGRVTGGTLEVFVDDEPIQVGTVSTSIGDTARTWYEGISYAKVETFRITGVAQNPNGSVTLTWNSIPAPTSLTSPTYTVQRKYTLSDPTWTTVATAIPSAGSSTAYTDNSPGSSAAYYRVAAP
jgi:hypothetical protein